MAITALLWLPAVFLYDLSAYPVSAGQAGALIAFPILYFAVVGIAMGATFALAPTRWGWLAGATAVVVSLPRLFVYDVTYLMVGVQARDRRTATAKRQNDLIAAHASGSRIARAGRGLGADAA